MSTILSRIDSRYPNVALAIRAGDWAVVRFMIDNKDHFDMKTGIESLDIEDMRVYYSLLKEHRNREDEEREEDTQL
jgi:hypothetical protein